MNASRISLGFALALGLVFLGTSAAEAAPVTGLVPAPAAIHAGGFGVGIAVGVPIRVAPPPRRVVVAPSGYWTWRTESVWVPGQVIGYDGWGRAIQTQGYWTERQVRIWVSTPAPVTVYRRAPVVVAPRPRVTIGLGFGFGFGHHGH